MVAPQGDAIEVGRFTVSAWPHQHPDTTATGDEAAMRALHRLHHALALTSVPVPRLAPVPTGATSC